jgi:hypothetical protein
MILSLSPWQGGRRLVTLSGAAGLAGLLVTLAGGLLGDPRRALFAYLVAFAYWIGIAIGALLLLGALHASNARWSVVARRFIETVPSVIPIFIVLFVPIVLGMRHLYTWFDPHALTGELAKVVAHRRGWLNGTGFVLRAGIYFVVWIVVAVLLRGWSVRQDSAGGVTLSLWQRRLGTGSIPFVAFAMSFAAFDWMMSLDPRFYSTIYGVYWFAGSFVSAIAVVLVAAAATQADPAGFGHFLNVDHFHALGKLLLAFVAFWGYVAFSQFMLIWIANIPEEVPWYILRINGGWKWVGAFLAVFHFLVPFFTLLQKAVTRNPRRLAWVAAWILLVHWIDLYWVVMPNVSPGGPRPSILDLAAFVGVGGVAVAWTVLRMRGVAAVPVRDPYLEDSLRYQPE